MNILLHNASSLSWSSAFLNNAHKLVPFLCYLDTHSSVCAFSWFCNPDIIGVTMIFIILLESVEVWVIKALLDMKSDRKCVEWILTDGFIVILHIHKKCLLVAQVVVVLNLICQFDRVGLKHLCLDINIHSCLFLNFFPKRWWRLLYLLRWGASHSCDIIFQFFSNISVAVTIQANHSHSRILRSCLCLCWLWVDRGSCCCGNALFWWNCCFWRLWLSWWNFSFFEFRWSAWRH